MYVLILDDLRHQFDATLIGWNVARAMGSEQDPPEWDSFRSRFDTALSAVPERVDAKQETMLRGLGLR